MKPDIGSVNLNPQKLDPAGTFCAGAAQAALILLCISMQSIVSLEISSGEA